MPPVKPAAPRRSASSSPAKVSASTAARPPARWPDRQAMTIRQPIGVAGLIVAGEHANRQRCLEGVSGAGVRQHRRPEVCRRHAGHGRALRTDGPRRGLARRRAQRRSRPRGGGGSLARRTRRCRRHQLHRLDGGRPRDSADRRRAAGARVARARWEEPVRRLRRRRPRRGGEMGGALGLQQRRAALRIRQPHHRLRGDCR